MSKNKEFSKDEKAHLNGGGDQPITDKQIKFINRLAHRKHRIKAGPYSYRILNKDISMLTGAEANMLIRKLMEIE